MLIEYTMKLAFAVVPFFKSEIVSKNLQVKYREKLLTRAYTAALPASLLASGIGEAEDEARRVRLA